MYKMYLDLRVQPFFPLLFYLIGRERTDYSLLPGENVIVPLMFRITCSIYFLELSVVFVLRYCTTLCYPVLEKRKCVFCPNVLSVRKNCVQRWLKRLYLCLSKKWK